MPSWDLEAGYGGPKTLVVGVDEVGNGALAGPVVAGAVLFTAYPWSFPFRLDDSKKLSKAEREAAVDYLAAGKIIRAIGEASIQEIDEQGILRATWLAMARAIKALSQRPTVLLIDGKHSPPFKTKALIVPVTGGDAKSNSIAFAASLAKVHRDALMDQLDRVHPGYGWHRNKGYGTRRHWTALTNLGMSPFHRRAFVHSKRARTSITDGMPLIED